MATREGIYVGGKDIVERYVGDKLVWSKWVYVGWFQYLYPPTESEDYLVFDITAKGGFFNNNYREENKVNSVKIRIKHSNNTITTVYGKYAYTVVPQSGYSSLHQRPELYVKFQDGNQKNFLKNNFADGDSLYFYFR